VQETLNACTELNVQQMRRAVDEIFREHSAAYKHHDKERLQLLDVDLTGMPCGRQAEAATQGYF
jgi:hypothetical protein